MTFKQRYSLNFGYKKSLNTVALLAVKLFIIDIKNVSGLTNFCLDRVSAAAGHGGAGPQGSPAI